MNVIQISFFQIVILFGKNPNSLKIWDHESEEKSEEMKALEIEVEECSDYPPDIDLNPKKQREEMSEKEQACISPTQRRRLWKKCPL